MTTTDVSGLPGEIRAQLARARISQDAACEAAGLPRRTYYRRDAMPSTWLVAELADLVDQAGADLAISFGTLDLDTSAPGADSWRLGELETLAKALGVALRIELHAHEVVKLQPDA